MADGPIIIQKDNVDDIPAVGRELPPWNSAQKRRLDWRIVAVCWAGGLLALPLLYWLFAHDVRDWATQSWGAPLIKAVAWGIPIAAGLFVLRRLLLVEQPGGFKVPLWQLDARPVIDGVLNVQHAYASTPFRQVGAYTLTNPTAPQLPEPEIIDAEPAAPDVGPLPRDTWLAWLDSQPHALFAAKTGGGKSTIAKAGLKPRIAGGEQVFIIDPHSNGWFELPGVGGGEDWRTVEEAMHAIAALYRERLAYREQYKKETGRELDQWHFPRLTVVLDEANLARDHFAAAYKGSRKTVSPWDTFAECLGSGARKTGISIWLLVQSALVEDLGMSGAKRENFTRFALDRRTVLDLADKDERDAVRRKALYAALRDAGDFPAAAIVKDDVYLLDRTGLDHVAPPANSASAAWAGWEYAAGHTVRPSAARVTFPPWCQSLEARIAYLAKTTQLSQRDIRDVLSCDMNTVNRVAGAMRNGHARV
jgi:hypothetical protein